MITKNEKESGKLVIFEKYSKNARKIGILRNKLSELLTERDYLIHVVFKNIETAYVLKFGDLEYKVYEAQCKYLRLKRKSEFIQAKINCGQEINISEIEDILLKEFEEYEQKLSEQIKKIEEAIKHNSGEMLSETETSLLKEIYRYIVKALHPDLNSQTTERDKELLNYAILAYKNGDIHSLRLIKEVLLHDKDTYDMSHTVMKEEIKRLLAVIREVRDDIAKKKTEHPYTLKDIVYSERKCEQRKEELKKTIEQYAEIIKAYELKIKEMIRGI